MHLITKFRILLAALVLAGASMFIGASPAQAGMPYVWNDYTGWVATYGVPNTTANVHHYARNGTKFSMNCWLDNQGRRWFLGTIYDTGSYVYVEARWVGSQWTVGRC